ncbi:MAG: hypothetical protein ACLFQV_08520 [Vulcanimicrobiota bacterium]
MILQANIAAITSMLPGGFFAQAAAVAKPFTTTEIVGTWIAAALTICIFSFLFEDNPLYKFAEHLFVGVSAGYWMATIFQNVIKPNLAGNIYEAAMLLSKEGTFNVEKWSFVIAGVLSIMLLLKLVPKISWISRWPLSFMVGIASGLGIVLTMEAFVFKQIDATIINLIVRHADNTIAWEPTIRAWMIVIGVCCSLLYFYFSVEHKGLFFGTTSRIGVFVLMMAFGAAFGYTVMARVSLLIGRMLFFRDDVWPAIKATFGG